jgi:hypothetical protein
MVKPGNAISAQALGDCTAEARSARSKEFLLKKYSELRKLGTTILESFRSLRKFYGGRRLSDSDIPPAKALPKQNPKSEYRNPKQFQIQNSKLQNSSPNRICLEHWVFLSFDLVSSFEFRASNLPVYLLAPFALCSLPFVFFVVDYVFFFGCGSAALGLCGEYSFTVNPEEV